MKHIQKHKLNAWGINTLAYCIIIVLNVLMKLLIYIYLFEKNELTKIQESKVSMQ
jgi:hypothetical protein